MFKRISKSIIAAICITTIILAGYSAAYAKDNIDNAISKDQYISEHPIVKGHGSGTKPGAQEYNFLTSKPASTAQTLDQIEDIIYESLINRTGKQVNVRIDYTGKVEDTIDQQIDKAIAKALDRDHYIRYSIYYREYGRTTTTHYTDPITYEMDLDFNFYFYTTPAEESFVDKEVDRILSKIIKPSMTDREKVKAIHDYVVLNTQYDNSKTRYTAYNILKEGTSVCNGYSLLGHKMLNAAGIPTRIIASGAMNHDWNLVKLDGNWYHMDTTFDDPIPDVKGRVLYDYYLLTDRQMIAKGAHSWYPEEYPTSGEVYTRNQGPKNTSGWKKEGGRWYYLDKNGQKQTGWAKVGGAWYYMNQNGIMQTGWTKVNGKWYYMDGSGIMQMGWVQSSGKWYYMNNSGAMETGWLRTGGKWYYMDNSGAMKTGWTKVSGKWYYMNNSGAMRTGWVQVGGKWYYLKSDGSMAYNTTIGEYKLGSDGAWIK